MLTENAKMGFHHKSYNTLFITMQVPCEVIIQDELRQNQMPNVGKTIELNAPVKQKLTNNM